MADGVTHHSYILRLWRATPAQPWQMILFSLATPAQRHHFTSLDALYGYLLAQDPQPQSPEHGALPHG